VRLAGAVLTAEDAEHVSRVLNLLERFPVAAAASAERAS
jgi:hypothetical protein